MKKILLIIALLTGVFTIQSCQKEDFHDIYSPEEDILQFVASIESSESTKTTVEKVDASPVTYKTNWENTDCIRIQNAIYIAKPYDTDATRATFTKTSGDAPTEIPYKAYYPATIFDGTTAVLPATYTYAEGKFNIPMYAESTTKILTFKDICGILAITINKDDISSVKSIKITSNEQLCGAFSITMDSDTTLFSFTDKELTENDKTITLNCTQTVTIADSKIFYIPIPPALHYPLTITVSDGTNTKIMTTLRVDGVQISRNTVYPLTFKENYKSGNTLSNELFSVSSSKQVKFSKSNLYWNGTAFHFEAKQYVYPTKWNPNHVDYFFWTTDAAKSYASVYNVETTATTDKHFADGSDNAHMLTVDGESGWYILNKDEWNYLLNTREGNRFAKARVNGIEGLLIFPDGYSVSTGTGIATINNMGSTQTPVTFPQENIPSQTWNDMESKVVFLPHANHRAGSNIEIVTSDKQSRYWLSNPAEIGSFAYYFGISSGGGGTGGNASRSLGYSLRLVKN